MQGLEVTVAQELQIAWLNCPEQWGLQQRGKEEGTGKVERMATSVRSDLCKKDIGYSEGEIL